MVLRCAAGLSLDRNSRRWERRCSLKWASSAAAEPGETSTCNATSRTSTQRCLALEERRLVEPGGTDETGRRDVSGVTQRDVTRCFLDSRNQTQHGVSRISKALQRKFRRYYFILGSFTSSHQSVGPYAPARKHASHLAVFIFIVIQQLQSMPGYLYHLPHKCHFIKRMVDTWGPRVQKSF